MKSATSVRRRTAASVAVLASAALLATGCASDEEVKGPQAGGNNAPAGANGSTALPELLTAEAEKAALAAAGGKKLGGSIEVLTPNGGREGQLIEETFKPFTKATGIEVKVQGSTDLETIVQTRSQSGNPPDVVIAAGAGSMIKFAKEGKLVPLDGVLDMNQVKKEYSQGLLDGASVDGKLFGVWSEVDNFMMWYNPKSYEGPKTPKTWDELSTWVKQQGDAGKPSWCMALEAGAGSGWPAATVIEQIFVGKWGEAKLKEWAEGRLPFSSPEVKWAFEEFGKMSTDPKVVEGGPKGVVATNIFDGGKGLHSDPTTCKLMPAGNYGGGMLMGAKTELQAGADVNFFMYPPADPANEGKQVIGGHVTYAFKNSPQAQAFMKYQASAAWQNLLASTGQWAVANNTVQPTVYPNELIRNSAVQLSQSPDVVAGPSFRAPADVLLAYQKSIISYIQKPGDLPKILADLDKIKRS